MRKGKVTASSARFIKLGAGGKFEQAALDDKCLYLGYHSVPHKDCRKGDWEAVNRLFLDEGHKPHVATNHARQVQAFYEEPESCLWITFVDGVMWWTFARPNVTTCIERNWRKIPREMRGPSRYRSCFDGWRKENTKGNLLLMRKLPGYVTKVVSGCLLGFVTRPVGSIYPKICLLRFLT